MKSSTLQSKRPVCRVLTCGIAVALSAFLLSNPAWADDTLGVSFDSVETVANETAPEVPNEQSANQSTATMPEEEAAGESADSTEDPAVTEETVVPPDQAAEPALTAERTVYVSSSGIFHFVSDCSGMKHYTEMSLSEAEAAGYRPCSNCVTGSETPVDPDPDPEPAPDPDPEPTPDPDPEPTIGFEDVPDGVWYVEQGWLDYVTSTGLMTGVKDPDGVIRNFYPEKTLTRGEVATILYRYANPDATDTTNEDDYATESHFFDVAAPYYYTAAINWCYENDIITGYTDEDGTEQGIFGADDPVTRAQLATMVYRFAESYLGVDVSTVDASAFLALPDHEDIYPYAIDAMTWCADQGIITGNIDPDGQPWLKSEDTATRTQMAKVITVLVRDVA